MRLTPHPSFSVTSVQRLARSERVSLSKLARGIDVRFAYNCRGALYQLLCKVRARLPERPVVLCPSYHCPTMIDPALAAGFDVRFYRISEAVEIDLEDLRGRLGNDVAVVIAVDYFGFRSNVDVLSEECRRWGVMVVRDCAHSFLRSNPTRLAGGAGDVAVFSLWKLIPSVVGGAIRFNDTRQAFQPEDLAVRVASQLRQAKRLCDELFLGLGDRPLARAYATLDAFLRRARHGSVSSSDSEPADPQPAREVFDYPFEARLARSRIPMLARAIIRAADLEFIASQRRRNYAAALGALSQSEELRPVRDQLPEDIVPWCLPVRLGKRRAIDYRLRAIGVPLFTFGETLHASFHEARSRDRSLEDAAVGLSRSIACLAVHQDMTAEDVAGFCAGAVGLIGPSELPAADGRIVR